MVHIAQHVFESQMF